MPSRRLPLALLLLPLVLGQQCAHYSRDDLVARLESRVSKCLGPSASSAAISTLTERFVTNDFDRHEPLALVLFSTSSDLLHSLAGAVASSLFGASRSVDTVQLVDFQTLLEPLRESNYDMKQTLRSALATPLSACPQRSLFVFDNLQALDEDNLPVLDVFLDPLNGKRAQFQHYVKNEASQVFDCSNSVFLFLYKAAEIELIDEEKSTRSALIGDWQEYLMQQWTRIEGETNAFTPQAFLGRVTDAVMVLPAKDDHMDNIFKEFKQSREWRRMCELQIHEADREVAEGGASTRASAMGVVADNVASAAPMLPGAIAMILIPAYLLLLTRAKRWNGGTTEVRKRAATHRRSSTSSNARRKKRKMRK
uniref:RxLR effector candidate protein n=1 Tax=Hyaloperonospora arabidopsidis (strain Emoy2) TaxID=559515 RepID=M4BVY5_HYAAE